MVDMGASTVQCLWVFQVCSQYRQGLEWCEASFLRKGKTWVVTGDRPPGA